MINKLKPKSEFSRNILTLMTGTTIAQAIPLAISPILTRIYTPEDFGLFALFVAISSILAVIVTGQYELSIMLPNNQNNAFHIVVLSIFINIIISSIILFLIIIFQENILKLIGGDKLENWIYVIPLSSFLIGFINTLTYWLNSQKKYKQLSYMKIIQSSTNSSSNILLGYSKFGYDGFIISQLLSQSLIAAFLLKKSYNNKYINNIKKIKIIALAKRYIKFPKVTMFHSLFNTFSNQFPIFMISYFFTTKDIGYYSFAIKIIAAPMSLVSSSFYQVFFEAFIKEKDKLKIYKHKFIKINVVFLPIFTLFWFLIPTVFEFIFGPDWKVAGIYAQILLPLIYLKFLSNLFTTTTYIYYERQLENLIIGIVIASMNIVALLIGGIAQDIKLGLFLMMVGNSSIILFKLYRSYSFVRGDKKC